MKLDDIMDLWEQDANIDETQLSLESLKTPKLHHKYFKMYSLEGLVLKKFDYEYKSLYKLKYEYYMGTIDQDTLSLQGWEPFNLKILKQDIPTYIESDPDIQTLQARIDVQKQKISFLESVIKVINNRGFLIKNSIDWQRFTSGV